jgi:branched-chain amino acid transport system permease protein
VIPAPDWIKSDRLEKLLADYLLGIGILVIAGVVCAFDIGGAYGTSVIIAFLFYAIVTLGWCLQAGHGGMFSLAPTATVMTSAYVCAVGTNIGVNIWFAVTLGIIAAATLGLLLALATSRLKSHYYALATLAAAEILRLVITNEYEITGGEAGLRTGPLYPGASGVVVALIFVFALAAMLTALLFALRGMPGMVVQAIRDDDEIAAIRGINVPRVKTIIVIIGSALMGFAGAIYVHYIQLATPQMGSLFQTTLILAIGIIGGIRTISGAIVGSAAIIALQEVLRDYPFTHMGITAVAILVVCLFAPAGVTGLILAKLKSATGRVVSSEQST